MSPGKGDHFWKKLSFSSSMFYVELWGHSLHLNHHSGFFLGGFPYFVTTIWSPKIGPHIRSHHWTTFNEDPSLAPLFTRTATWFKPKGRKWQGCSHKKWVTLLPSLWIDIYTYMYIEIVIVKLFIVYKYPCNASILFPMVEDLMFLRVHSKSMFGATCMGWFTYKVGPYYSSYR